MRSIKYILIVLLILISISLKAQNVAVRAWLDTNNVLIGDQLKLILEARSDKKTKIVFPIVPDTIGKIEVLNRSKIDTLDSNGLLTYKQQFVITSFDSGWHTLPSMTFSYTTKGMTDEFTAWTDSLPIKFNTVDVDTSQAIKDIKPPLDEAISWEEYLLYFIIGVVVIGLGFLGYYLWKRYKKKKENPLDYDPKIPAHIIALEALKQLDSEKLWQKGKVKLYHIRLTEIIRLYIERRFNIPALEMITSDIIESLNKVSIIDELIFNMRRIFETADLVKFAKFQPLPNENTLVMTIAEDFINRTIPAQNEQAQKEEESGQ
ncbi:MAG: hypothetical protein EPN82_07905 [Bacteroidetes bacterium]|nr:MAG: hypothetical protein EPN82_07905 [Bacteroidota bacterium]